MKKDKPKFPKEVTKVDIDGAGYQAFLYLIAWLVFMAIGYAIYM